MSKPTTTTTKERKIEFMWHLYSQKFTQQEIANVYGITIRQVDYYLHQYRFKRMS